MLDRPEVIRKVLKDYVDQVERLQKNPALWVQTYQNYTGLNRPVAEMSLTRTKFSLRFSQDELSNFAKFLLKEGLAKSPTLAQTVRDHYVYGPLSLSLLTRVQKSWGRAASATVRCLDATWAPTHRTVRVGPNNDSYTLRCS